MWSQALAAVFALSASLVLATSTSRPAAQINTATTGAITGIVVDAHSGAPIPGATVSLGRQVSFTTWSEGVQLTDERGRFAFIDLAPNDHYVVSTSVSGYFEGWFNCAVAASQWVRDRRIALWRPAAVGGTVTDETGEPVIGVFVRVLSEVLVGGTPQLANGPVVKTDDRGTYRISGLTPGVYIVNLPSVQASIPSDTSDEALRSTAIARTEAIDLADRARLVVSSGSPIPPAARNGRVQAMPVAFYGGTSIAEATRITLDYGDDRNNLDIRWETTPTVRVSGTIDGPAEARANVLVRLIPEGLDDLGHGSEAATTRSDGAGHFVFPAVPTGRYTIDVPFTVSEYQRDVSPIAGMRPLLVPTPGFSRATSLPIITGSAISGPPNTTFTTTTYGGGDRRWWGRQSIAVGTTDIADVILRLKMAARMSGTIVIDPDSANEVQPSILSVRAEPADGRITLGWLSNQTPRTAPTRMFTIDGLQPGPYLLRGITPVDWVVKSVIFDGQDRTELPFDGATGSDFRDIVVTVTHRVAMVDGMVRTSAGRLAESTVVLFPADSAHWKNYGLIPGRIKLVEVLPTGRFQIPTAPAGDYYIVAVPGIQPDVWQDPSFFSRMSGRATRISLGWGDRRTVDLRITE